MRSAICSTSARSWAMNSMAMPRLFWRFASRLTICARTERSSAETGSSATSSSGRGASARAMPMRWRWPPENSCGIPRRRPRPAARPRPASRRRGRTAPARAASPWTSSGSKSAVADPQARVERAVGVLEDHLEVAPAPGAARGPPQREEVLAAEPDLAARSARPGARSSGRGWSCPIPTPPPARRSRRRATSRSTPSTAATAPSAPQERRAEGELLGQAADLRAGALIRRAVRARSPGSRRQRPPCRAAAGRTHTGRFAGAALDPGGTARREDAARRQAVRLPAPGPESPAARRAERARRAPGSTASRPRVYGCAGRSKSSAAGADSTISPAYMTSTRSQVSATTARSWVISRMASPSSRRRRSSSSRICACSVTSRAVVGSSAISSSGPAASAIAIIARCR